MLFSINGFSSKISYKNGEQLFANYCSGCHSLNYTTFPKVAIPNAEAKKWFGIIPPDLSLVTKYRGKLWIRTYLQSFYYDSSRPFNCNNKLIHNVQMPNVLYPLENTGSYTQNIEDIVAFLDIVSDPHRKKRYMLGVCVEIFLGILLLALYKLR